MRPAENLRAPLTRACSGEAQQDARVVEKSHIPLLWKEERNQWRGERKQWDWFVEGGMWHENGYWMGFNGGA